MSLETIVFQTFLESPVSASGADNQTFPRVIRWYSVFGPNPGQAVSGAIPLRTSYNQAVRPRGPRPLFMSDVTQLLVAIGHGDQQASAELLPLVYEELRRLAAEKMAQERPGQTLQATALVHEAYLRLVDGKDGQQWDNRWHFYAAAAEAMRRIVLNCSAGQEAAQTGWRPPPQRF